MGGYSFDTAPRKKSKSGPEDCEMTGRYVSKVEPLDDSSSHSGSSDHAFAPKDPEPGAMVGVFEVFRFSTASDRLLMLIGTVSACIHGAAMPVMMILFGDITDTFVGQGKAGWVLNNIIDYINNDPNTDFHFDADDVASNMDGFMKFLASTNCSDPFGPANCTLWGNDLADSIMDVFMDSIRDSALKFTYMGCGVLLVGYLQMMCWHIASYNQSERIRTSLFRSILKQDISWFDTHEVGELSNRLVDDVDQIENGIGDKIALFFQYIATFFAGFIVGFVHGWKLTLVILSVSPLLALSAGFMARLMSAFTKRELEAYAKAGAVAEEVLGAMRTVTAFGGQQKEVERYSVNLRDAQALGVKKGLINGIGMGSVFMIMFGSYALAFWYGSTLVFDENEPDYTAGTMLIVFFSVLMGAFSIGSAAPNIEDFSNARGAAYIVYSIIDMVPPIDSSSPLGLKPESGLTGNIEFKDVVFRYPSRPGVPILQGFNLKVNTGQTIALVGSSGCGKSTCIQLIQRFYDPLSGKITIDGTDVKDFNLKWLRQQIGVVSQEPILFGTTIAENIRYGREGVTMEEIEQATREANAHDFISKLPLKYDTLVGERGAQLSGGQKQRIAIARALVRDPKILLLDEATSALDTESESTVQAALDKARQGRTTIVVAHRLSTIQTADIIAGVSDGVIVEQGSHAELMLKQGVYYTLVTNQMQLKKAEEEPEEVEAVKKPPPHVLERGVSRQSAKLERSRSRTMSTSSNSDKKTLAKADENLPEASMGRIMKLNAPEWPYIVGGCCSAVVMGCIQPAFALIFSNIIGIFAEEPSKETERKCNIYSGMFAVIGVVACISNFGQFFLFAKSGEYLTTRLRKMAFHALLRQDIGYYDDHLNSTGALCSRLSTDASSVKGATGSRLASLIQSFAAIAGGVIIGFIFSWKLTLVVLAFAPFMLFGGFIKMRVFTGGHHEKSLKMEAAAKIATEAVENIRTVANLTKEEKFADFYAALVGVPYNSMRRKAHLLGIAYSYSAAIIFFSDAGCFMFGAYLVKNDGLAFDDMFKVFTAIIFGAMAAGRASSMAPDYSKAKLAAARLFALFDRVPIIDSYSEEGLKLSSITGSVELRDVKFTYPTRPDVPVLKGVTVEVKPGEMVALVGSSGCGKSTIVQLIERFYDPAEGHVVLDGHKTQSLHIQWFRSQIGIVSQEPILFDCSIRDNIAYGDNFRDVTMEEIIAAARQANIHTFIESLPQGYETNVGDKGAQLSGGQKQRVAIARALIRNPKILLLDEATSALDTESEKVVQEALERAQQGRTSIVIAHRLSTIRNANHIVVLHNGLIAEVGTHNELMAAQGFYYRLNSKQQAKGAGQPSPPVYEEVDVN